jgi:5-methylcytosine-specific restriction endonuclease McrA
VSVATLETNALVLNRVYQAIQVTSVRRAVTLLYLGHARAVMEDYSTYSWEEWKDIPVSATDEFVTTPSYRFRAPRVVQVLTFDRVPRHEVKFTRKNVFARDGNQCQYCGRRFPTRELNLDHVVPMSRGGKTTWDNVVCCCLPCNARKGNYLPEEIGLHLVRRPRKPRWYPFIRLVNSGAGHETWRNFLDVAYWNV